MKQRFPIGTEYTYRAGKKDPQKRKVVDVLFTYNSKDDLVKLEYVVEYDFCGQRSTDTVGDTQIARSLCDEHGDGWIFFMYEDSQQGLVVSSHF